MAHSTSFIEVLAALMSPNNDVRRQAEQYYEHQLHCDVMATIQELVGILSNSGCDATLRSLSGILLRRSVNKMASVLHPDAIGQLKASLLSLWTGETQPLLTKRIAHIIAEICAQSPWEDLIPSLLAYAQQQIPGAASESFTVSLLNLVEILCEYSPEIVSTQIQPLCPFLGNAIAEKNTSNSNSNNIRVASARTICACIEVIDDDKSRNIFKPALQSILEVLGASLSRGEECDATIIMDKLVAIADIQPLFFKGSLESLVNAMLVVANAAGLDFSTRSMALELMVTLCETAPAMSRKCLSLVQGLVPVGMSIMLDVEEEEFEWVQGKYEENVDDCPDENCRVGEEAIERLAAGLGARVVPPVVLPFIQQFAASPDWKHRRAAVTGLLRLAEGLGADGFQPYLSEAIGFLARTLREDPSQRVKYEAIQAVGRFASLFPTSSSSLVNTFVPLLVSLLDCSSSLSSSICNKVRGHAASALINLTNPDSSCEESVLQPHLPGLLGALLGCLQSVTLDIRLPCLQLLGSVARAAPDAFTPFYSSFIPGIKSILRATATASSGNSSGAADLAVFRGKTMECIGLIAEAVGPSVFGPDAQEIMEILVQALLSQEGSAAAGGGGGGETDSSTAVFDYVLPACARISKSLGRHFQPFLSVVMPPLLAAAQQTVYYAIEDADETDAVGEVVQDEETGYDSTVVQFGPASASMKKRITVSTHAAQQQQQAARMIHDFADSMKGNLQPFIVPCLHATLPLLAAKNISDTRAAASMCLAKLFDAAVAAVAAADQEQQQQQQQHQDLSGELLQHILDASLSKMTECLRGESNADCRGCLAEAMRDTLAACYQSGTDSGALDGKRVSFLCRPDLHLAGRLAEDLLAKWSESLDRRRQREKSFAANDGLDREEDRAALDEQLEVEDDLVRSLVDALGQLLKLHGPAFMPLFDARIAPHFAPFLSPQAPVSLQIAAICLIDDVLEFGGSEALKYVPLSLQTLLSNVFTRIDTKGVEQEEQEDEEDEDLAVLRQCSMYGIAQIVGQAPEMVLPVLLSAVLPALGRAIDDAAASSATGAAAAAASEDCEGVAENAVFALGHILCCPQYRAALSSLPGAAGTDLPLVWLRHLPLTLDEAETKLSAKQLVQLVEIGDTLLLGDNLCNLCEVVRVFADTLLASRAYRDSNRDEMEFAPAYPATIQRMEQLLRDMAGSVSAGQVMQQAFAGLSPAQQQVLQCCINNSETSNTSTVPVSIRC